MRFVKLSGGLTINLEPVAYFYERPETVDGPPDELGQSHPVIDPATGKEKTTGRVKVTLVIPGVAEPPPLDYDQSAEFLAAVAALESTG